MIRLVATGNLPLSIVNNAEWIALVDEFMTGVQNVKRDALTQRVLPRIIDEHRAQAKAATRGKDVTVQGDGWTGLNLHHLVAFMITTAGKVRLIYLIDAHYLIYSRYIQFV